MALGPVKAHVKAAAESLATKFGIRTMYGWRPVDPFPDHPSGLAVDFMTSNLPNGKATGDALAAHLVANAGALGIKYIIWWRRSWSASRGTWVDYKSTPNPHTDHVHATWNATPGSGSVVDASLLPAVDTVGNPISDVKEKVDAMFETFKKVSAIAEWLGNKDNMLRMQIGAFGVAFILFGLLKFDKVAAIATTAVKQAGKVVKNGGK